MSMSSIIEASKKGKDLYGFTFMGEWHDWCTHKWEPMEICSKEGYMTEEAVMYAANHTKEEWDKMARAHKDWRNERMTIYRYAVALLMEVPMEEE